QQGIAAALSPSGAALLRPSAIGSRPFSRSRGRAEIVRTMLRRVAASTRTFTAEPPPEPQAPEILPGHVPVAPRAAAELIVPEGADVLGSTAGRDTQALESRLPRAVRMALAVAAALIVSALSGYVLMLKRAPHHSASASPAAVVSSPIAAPGT